MAEKTLESGERVVLGKRVNSMVKFRWSGNEPEGLDEMEHAEELGTRWQGDELVSYDYSSLVELLTYYKDDDYLADND
jgi:hypothetical protein